MRSTISKLTGLVVIAALAAGCSGGISSAEHDKVLSELALRNQELAGAQAEIQRLQDAAQESNEMSSQQVADLSSELQRIEGLYEQYLDGANQNLADQQLLLELGTAFVEFHGSPREALTVQHFEIPATELGDEMLTSQLNKWADSIGTEAESYEYGVLGFEIMLALGRAMEPPPPLEP